MIKTHVGPGNPWQNNESEGDEALPFIGRRAIVDARRNIFGYELLIEQRDGLDASHVVEALKEWFLHWPFKDEMLIVDGHWARHSKECRQLLGSHDNVGITYRPGEVPLDELRGLHEVGLALVADYAHANANVNAAAPAVDSAYADTRAPAFTAFARMPVDALKPEYARRPQLGQNRIRAISSGVNDHEQFQAMHQQGVELFQGTWYLLPGRPGAQPAKPGAVRILAILDLLTEQADLRDIESIVKQDVVLSFKLLRYVNSAGFGLARGVESFRHAITVLGYDKLRQWLLLVLAIGERDAGASALVRTAVTRGRFAELIGTGRVARDDTDRLFLVGMFSVIEALVDMPMAAALNGLPLAPGVTQALLNGTGPYSDYLELVRGCENCDFNLIPILAQRLELTPREVNQAHVGALAWANGLDL